jgi:hypothetical protein
MIHPLSRVGSCHLETSSSGSYKVVNQHALERRVGRCAEDAFGQNALQDCARCDGESVYCGGDHCLDPAG